MDELIALLLFNKVSLIIYTVVLILAGTFYVGKHIGQMDGAELYYLDRMKCETLGNKEIKCYESNN